jgi:hypothetical protein
MPLTNSASCRLLIRPVLTHSLVGTYFWSQVIVLIRFLTDWTYRCLVRFLGHKKHETCWGLSMGSVGNMLGFLTPTQTHVFDNRNNSYGHLNTGNVRSLLIRWLDDATHPNLPHQNKKKRSAIANYLNMVAQTLSQNVSNGSTHVNVPTEDGSQQSATFTHALKGSSTFVPIHALSRQVLLYPLQCPRS